MTFVTAASGRANTGTDRVLSVAPRAAKLALGKRLLESSVTDQRRRMESIVSHDDRPRFRFIHGLINRRFINFNCAQQRHVAPARQIELSSVRQCYDMELPSWSSSVVKFRLTHLEAVLDSATFIHYNICSSLEVYLSSENLLLGWTISRITSNSLILRHWILTGSSAYVCVGVCQTAMKMIYFGLNYRGQTVSRAVSVDSREENGGEGELFTRLDRINYLSR